VQPNPYPSHLNVNVYNTDLQSQELATMEYASPRHAQAIQAQSHMQNHSDMNNPSRRHIIGQQQQQQQQPFNAMNALPPSSSVPSRQGNNGLEYGNQHPVVAAVPYNGGSDANMNIEDISSSMPVSTSPSNNGLARPVQFPSVQQLSHEPPPLAASAMHVPPQIHHQRFQSRGMYSVASTHIPDMLDGEDEVALYGSEPTMNSQYTPNNNGGFGLNHFQTASQPYTAVAQFPSTAQSMVHTTAPTATAVTDNDLPWSLRQDAIPPQAHKPNTGQAHYHRRTVKTTTSTAPTVATPVDASPLKPNGSFEIASVVNWGPKHSPMSAAKTNVASKWSGPGVSPQNAVVASKANQKRGKGDRPPKRPRATTKTGDGHSSSTVAQAVINSPRAPVVASCVNAVSVPNISSSSNGRVISTSDEDVFEAVVSDKRQWKNFTPVEDYNFRHEESFMNSLSSQNQTTPYSPMGLKGVNDESDMSFSQQQQQHAFMQHMNSGASPTSAMMDVEGFNRSQHYQGSGQRDLYNSNPQYLSNPLSSSHSQTASISYNNNMHYDPRSQILFPPSPLGQNTTPTPSGVASKDRSSSTDAVKGESGGSGRKRVRVSLSSDVDNSTMNRKEIQKNFSELKRLLCGGSLPIKDVSQEETLQLAMKRIHSLKQELNQLTQKVRERVAVYSECVHLNAKPVKPLCHASLFDQSSVIRLVTDMAGMFLTWSSNAGDIVDTDVDTFNYLVFKSPENFYTGMHPETMMRYVNGLSTLLQQKEGLRLLQLEDCMSVITCKKRHTVWNCFSWLVECDQPVGIDRNGKPISRVIMHVGVPVGSREPNPAANIHSFEEVPRDIVEEFAKERYEIRLREYEEAHGIVRTEEKKEEDIEKVEAKKEHGEEEEEDEDEERVKEKEKEKEMKMKMEIEGEKSPRSTVHEDPSGPIVEKDEREREKEMEIEKTTDMDDEVQNEVEDVIIQLKSENEVSSSETIIESVDSDTQQPLTTIEEEGEKGGEGEREEEMQKDIEGEKLPSSGEKFSTEPPSLLA